ncbi:MAG: NAD(+) diphosphatase [Pseudomonadota bacterium]
MKPGDNPNWFAQNPLQRLNNEQANGAFIDERLVHAASLLVPLWRGDPLVANGQAAFLSIAARSSFPDEAEIVFLGLKNDIAYFGVDASGASETPEAAPFADLGDYMPIRQAAGVISKDDLAIIGQARWLFEWRRKNVFCSVCGGSTKLLNGGAKSQCEHCGAEHFPRSDPVAIVLAIHEDACLLGRSPHFPPGFLSALAGFVEAGETPEEAARREVFEEAGVRLSDVRYQFSQPWPFPSSMMMGFIADAEGRDLNLDEEEIVEARWIEKKHIQSLMSGGEYEGVRLPPDFTIARQLLDVWAKI